MNKSMLRLLALVLGVLLFMGNIPAFAGDLEAALGGPGTAESYRWYIDDGDLIPADDSLYDVGASGKEVANVYADTLTLGGVAITGVSSLSTPMEDEGTYVQPIDGAGSIKLYDNGNLVITGAFTGDSATLENGAVLANAVNNAVTLVENSDTLTMSFTGNDLSLDMSDGGVIFALTDATDGTVDFMTNNDVDDYIQISTAANQPLINFVGCNGKITAASGAISFDNENLSTTGTLSAGATTVTSLIIGDDTLSRTTDDVFEFLSNDEHTTVLITGFESKDAILKLSADQSDDNGDDWQLVSNQADNTFTLENDTSGAMVAKLTVGTNGDVTTTRNMTIGGAFIGGTDAVTATSAGVAASLNSLTTIITTNGDADLDNVTLADGTAGQIKIFCIKVEGAAGDTVKITPANMAEGTQITFDGTIGQGCTMVFDGVNWAVVANNGGTIA